MSRSWPSQPRPLAGERGSAAGSTLAADTLFTSFLQVALPRGILDPTGRATCSQAGKAFGRSGIALLPASLLTPSPACSSAP